MVRGSFKIWEAVFAGIGISSGMIVNFFISDKGDDTIQMVFGCFMFAALAFFVRPIWLLVNRRQYDKEHSAVVTDIYIDRYYKIGNYKFSKLAYGKKKDRREITAVNVMFFTPIIGEIYELALSSRTPGEFLILSAARMNAVVFAVLGIAAEITLILIMLNLKG